MDPKPSACVSRNAGQAGAAPRGAVQLSRVRRKFGEQSLGTILDKRLDTRFAGQASADQALRMKHASERIVKARVRRLGLGPEFVQAGLVRHPWNVIDGVTKHGDGFSTGQGKGSRRAVYTHHAKRCLSKCLKVPATDVKNPILNAQTARLRHDLRTPVQIAAVERVLLDKQACIMGGMAGETLKYIFHADQH